MKNRKVINLFSRYFIAIIFGLGNIYIFYKILTPLTIKFLAATISIFTQTIIKSNNILIAGYTIEIIPACVAGSAFYLLFLLLMATPMKGIKTRIYAVLTSFLILFILNIARMSILILFLGTESFETVHWVFWHIFSTFFVLIAWYLTIKIHKIKSIPVYSDLKFLYSLKKDKKTKTS